MLRSCSKTFSFVSKLSNIGLTTKQLAFGFSTTGLRASLLYTDKHEWIRQDNANAVVGICNHAQEALGELVYVQLPEVGSDLKQFSEACVVESVKAASDVYSPASGSVTEVNEKLVDNPSLVNKSCYEDGWLYKMKLSDMAELKNLLNEEQYNALLKNSDGA